MMNDGKDVGPLCPSDISPASEGTPTARPLWIPAFAGTTIRFL